ncbi:alpha-2-macroglobulin family protein, partial [Myxococcus sp. 1LA]
MNRSFFAGVGCSLASLVGLLLVVTLFGDNVRRLFGASAEALAGEPAPRVARLITRDEAFGSGARGDSAPAPAVEMEMEMGAVVGGADGLRGESAHVMKKSMARKGGGGAEADASPSRAWFPETFLFEPLVVTDASGAATVPVRVPDRLTQWRVLALAHSRSGAQSGAVTAFTGTLPTYVDPVLPAFLRAGDAVRVPVQVMNTTDAAVEAPLKVEVPGAWWRAAADRARPRARQRGGVRDGAGSHAGTGGGARGAGRHRRGGAGLP